MYLSTSQLYLIALHACTILRLYSVPFAFLLITSCTLVYLCTLVYYRSLFHDLCFSSVQWETMSRQPLSFTLGLKFN